MFLTAPLWAGAPWFDRLGIDPAWMIDSAKAPARIAAPLSGIDIHASSDLAIRDPLRVSWGRTRFSETFATGTTKASFGLQGWFSHGLSSSTRGISSGETSLSSPRRSIDLSSGLLLSLGPTLWKTGFSSGSDKSSVEASAGIRSSRLDLEVGVSRTDRRSDLGIEAPQGALSLAWHDRSDSLGTLLGFDLEWIRFEAAAWTREDRSPREADFVDSGRAGGWSARIAMPSRWGEWEGSYALERSTSRTLGSRDGSVWHDQDWNTARGRMELRWSPGRWRISAGRRQMRIGIPSGGIERPFIHWNLVPDDRLTWTTSVLQDEAEHIEGRLDVASTLASVGRTWSRGRWTVSAGIGAAFTEFGARVDRTRVEIRALFPRTTDDVPVDGSGWLATADARASIEWNTRELGVLRMGGLWRQPFAGSWTSRLETSEPAAPSESPSGSDASPVDPTGFHAWSFSWLLAI